MLRLVRSLQKRRPLILGLYNSAELIQMSNQRRMEGFNICTHVLRRLSLFDSHRIPGQDLASIYLKKSLLVWWQKDF